MPQVASVTSEPNLDEQGAKSSSEGGVAPAARYLDKTAKRAM